MVYRFWPCCAFRSLTATASRMHFSPALQVFRFEGTGRLALPTDWVRLLRLGTSIAFRSRQERVAASQHHSRNRTARSRTVWSKSTARTNWTLTSLSSSTVRISLSPRSSCRPLSTGELEFSTVSRYSPLDTIWRLITGRSFAATATVVPVTVGWRRFRWSWRRERLSASHSRRQTSLGTGSTEWM
jgi:hypothetical protein